MPVRLEDKLSFPVQGEANFASGRKGQIRVKANGGNPDGFRKQNSIVMKRRRRWEIVTTHKVGADATGTAIGKPATLRWVRDRERCREH